MATITGFTSNRMKAIEDGTVVDGSVIGDNLILQKHDGSTIDAGDVRGPQGVVGPAGGNMVVYNRITNVNTNVPGGIGAVVIDIPGMGLTWTADPTRLYRFSYSFNIYNFDGVNGEIQYCNPDGDRLQIQSVHYKSNQQISGFFYDTGLSGSVTRKLRIYDGSSSTTTLQASDGGGSGENIQYFHAMVEDMGPA